MTQTGICPVRPDVDSRYGGRVPPMFWLRDPDRNSLIIVQRSA